MAFYRRTPSGKPRNWFIDRSGCNICLAHRASVTDASCLSTFCRCNIGTSFWRLACPFALCSTPDFPPRCARGHGPSATEPLRRLSIFRSQQSHLTSPRGSAGTYGIRCRRGRRFYCEVCPSRRCRSDCRVRDRRRSGTSFSRRCSDLGALLNPFWDRCPRYHRSSATRSSSRRNPGTRCPEQLAGHLDRWLR